MRAALPAALPPVVLLPVDALAHQHARARRRLEHVVHALDLQRGALLVRARADRARHALRLLARHEVRELGRVRGRPQVRFAAHEQHGDGRAADGAHFFYPLGAESG